MTIVNCFYYTTAQRTKEVGINLDNISHILYDPYNDGYGFKDEASIVVVMKKQFMFQLTGDSSKKLIRLLAVSNSLVNL